MSCQERDRIILAFALAANESNIAAGDLELAANESERRMAQQSVDTAKRYCYQLRDRILSHCRQHGC
jgi:hypothetical protein